MTACKLWVRGLLKSSRGEKSRSQEKEAEFSDWRHCSCYYPPSQMACVSNFTSVNGIFVTFSNWQTQKLLPSHALKETLTNSQQRWLRLCPWHQRRSVAACCLGREWACPVGVIQKTFIELHQTGGRWASVVSWLCFQLPGHWASCYTSGTLRFLICLFGDEDT